MAQPLRISADEVNCLIYSYFQDSGLQHSAFAICMEGQLECSPNFTKHIPRGELIELLSKALLYIEVESHWRNDNLASNCKSTFTLLEPHVCSLEPPPLKPISFAPVLPTSEGDSQAAAPTHTNGTPGPDLANKRKASPVGVDGPAEKKIRRDMDDMDVESSSESSKPKNPITTTISKHISPEPATKKQTKPKPRAQVLGPEEGQSVALLDGNGTEVFVCSFNPVVPGLLATGSKDSVVVLWKFPNAPPNDPAAPPTADIMSKVDQFQRPDGGDMTSLHWTRDGSLLAIGSYDCVLRICTASGELYFSKHQHQGPIFSTRFSRSGRWLLTASIDGTTCLWDVKEKRLHKQYRCHTDCCLDVDWLDETIFASCGADQVIHILSVGEDYPIKTLHGHTNEINQLKFNRGGTRLASCSDDMTARVWNVDNIASRSTDSIPGLVASSHVVTLEGHKHSVSTVAWCPDHPTGTHELLASSSFDGTARIWDSVTGECLKIFTDHRRPVYTLTFSPNGRLFATGGGDGWLHVYSTRTREKRWSWQAGPEKPGIFEIDWEVREGINRIAMAMECRRVGVVDVSRIPALQNEASEALGSI
ncbi:WD40-repeat-containing domain protein [Infundibulicybe gibba]|nr:WD40-repeat-containing domain protein [Infundibulicybe gibba]